MLEFGAVFTVEGKSPPKDRKSVSFVKSEQFLRTAVEGGGDLTQSQLIRAYVTQWVENKNRVIGLGEGRLSTTKVYFVKDHAEGVSMCKSSESCKGRNVMEHSWVQTTTDLKKWGKNTWHEFKCQSCGVKGRRYVEGPKFDKLGDSIELDWEFFGEVYKDCTKAKAHLEKKAAKAAAKAAEAEGGSDGDGKADVGAQQESGGTVSAEAQQEQVISEASSS